MDLLPCVLIKAQGDIMISDINEANRRLENLRNSFEKLQGEHDRLRAALEAVEWVDSCGTFGCPWCGQLMYAKHAPDCARQRALGL